jgi:hypothetical protein
MALLLYHDKRGRMNIKYGELLISSNQHQELRDQDGNGDPREGLSYAVNSKTYKNVLSENK